MDGHDVYGAIGARYLALSGSSWRLGGLPVTGECDVDRAGGRIRRRLDCAERRDWRWSRRLPDPAGHFGNEVIKLAAPRRRQLRPIGRTTRQGS